MIAHRHALLIGINQYEDAGQIPPLKYAQDDARELAQVLGEKYGFLTRCLMGEEATREEILDVLHTGRLSAKHPQWEPDDQFLFFFAGHGELVSGAYVLHPYDARATAFHRSVAVRDLGQFLRGDVRAGECMCILDACRNLAHRGARGAAGLDPDSARDIRAVASSAQTTKLIEVLYGCEEGGQSWEDDRFRHGVLTHHLLGVLRQPPPTVTFETLVDELAEQMRGWRHASLSGVTQMPLIERTPGRRRIVLASKGERPSDDRTAPVEILEEPALHIETVPAGAVVSIDGRRTGTAPLKLTLTAGQYRLRAELDGYQPWEKRIRFDAAGDAQLRIELVAKPRIVAASFPMTAEQAAEVQRAAAEALGLPLQDELDCGQRVKLKLVLIPAGNFLMGSPDSEAGRYSNEGPQHEVAISKPFCQGIHTVTQAQYRAVTGQNPSKFKGDSNPVECLSWDEASAFCRKLTEKTGRVVRLPREAEWEYACRAGSRARFYFGDADEGLVLYAWFDGNAASQTHPVGQKKPNAWGLYDMHGNVWEWCADWYADSYSAGKAVDPKGPSSGEYRVLRGGSWSHRPGHCRSAYRLRVGPGHGTYRVGFRVVVDL